MSEGWNHWNVSVRVARVSIFAAYQPFSLFWLWKPPPTAVLFQRPGQEDRRELSPLCLRSKEALKEQRIVNIILEAARLF